ncbi:globin domain-containing protein [Dinoroseobacter sp. S76]|uniref:globin domain-containing protein n=1 Tax=Dinoroseobacter sp. S76 TaxID=3415124 RepID=UPI003C7CE3EB
MDTQDIARVQDSFAQIKPGAEALVGVFYARLFARTPALRAMFPQEMDAQRKKLTRILATAVAALAQVETLVPALKEMGARHVTYGVTPEHYDLVGEALLGALAAALGPRWTPELAASWTAVYGVLAGTMLAGAEAATALDAV